MPRESKLIINCKSCKQKLNKINLISEKDTNSKNSLPTFPVGTAFTKNDLDELIENGYSCPFCGESVVVTDNLASMFFRLLHGPSHIFSGNNPNLDQIELSPIYGGHYSISLDENIESLESYLYKYGIHIKNIDHYVFANPKTDLPLLQKGMMDIDREKWTILIESGLNPEPFLQNEDAWFNLWDN